MTADPFQLLPRGHYGAIYADPPWHFEVWSLEKFGDRATSAGGATRHPSKHYKTMPIEDIYALPVADLAAPDCVLFMWVIWPMLEHGLQSIKSWGFKYKTCGFAWVKANGRQADLFHDDVTPDMLTGYWTRANSEVCLLATRGKPKRIDAGVRQAIIEPRREHSRKPDCVYDRIERLVPGPYLELFARTQRRGWDAWGNEVGKFAGSAA